MKRIGITLFAVIIACLAFSASSFAITAEDICVPEKASASVKTPNAEDKCPAANTKEYVLQASDYEVLEHIRYNPIGVAGLEKPTLEVKGVNLQVYANTGTGVGNLFVGPGPQGLQDRNNLIVGKENSALGEYDLISGVKNSTEEIGTVAFGKENQAKSEYSTVLGGSLNTAGSGGSPQKESTIVGGRNNSTFNGNSEGSVIAGGKGNVAKTPNDLIAGGFENTAETASFVTITGGKAKVCKVEYALC